MADLVFQDLEDIFKTPRRGRLSSVHEGESLIVQVREGKALSSRLIITNPQRAFRDNFLTNKEVQEHGET
jgi:hypothetical protein